MYMWQARACTAGVIFVVSHMLGIWRRDNDEVDGGDDDQKNEDKQELSRQLLEDAPLPPPPTGGRRKRPLSAVEFHDFLQLNPLCIEA